MTTELLYHQPAALIAIALLACMVIAAELGYKLGRRGRHVLVQREMEFSAFKISYSALPVRVHHGLGPRRRP